jgi:hypothetical protein
VGRCLRDRPAFYRGGDRILTRINELNAVKTCSYCRLGDSSVDRKRNQRVGGLAQAFGLGQRGQRNRCA